MKCWFTRSLIACAAPLAAGMRFGPRGMVKVGVALLALVAFTGSPANAGFVVNLYINGVHVGPTNSSSSTFTDIYSSGGVTFNVLDGNITSATDSASFADLLVGEIVRQTAGAIGSTFCADVTFTGYTMLATATSLTANDSNAGGAIGPHVANFFGDPSNGVWSNPGGVAPGSATTLGPDTVGTFLGPTTFTRSGAFSLGASYCVSFTALNVNSSLSFEVDAEVPATSLPEPASLSLALIGLVAFTGLARKRLFKV
jgi:hypothetical protein